MPLPIPAERLETWPGRELRNPARSNPDYLAKALLAGELRDAVATYCGGASNLDVLDIGCGEKPYLPILHPHASSYRGIDVVPGPAVDDVGVAEQLPYPDQSFDVVLCTQVLEHADDPARVVSEIHRVLRPSGLALLSTHGVFVFHPDPAPDRDFWRWTHSGLARLFRTAGDWSELAVRANGEYFSCLALLTSRLLGWPLGALPSRLRGLVYLVINWAGPFLDRRLPTDMRVPHPNSLSANYLVVARRAPRPTA